MTHANGTHLDMDLKAGNPSDYSSRTQWYHCHQARPESRYVWDAWAAACNLFATRVAGKLRRPLGRWLIPPSQQRRQWCHYYDLATGHMYRRSLHQGYERHLRVPGGFSLQSSRNVAVLPPRAIPMDCLRTAHVYVNRNSHHRLIAPLPAPTAPAFLQAYIRQGPSWERDLFFGLSLTTTDAAIVALIASGDFLLASDGSAPGVASFGWVLSTKSGDRLAVCSGPVCGHRPTPFRAEAFGVLSALRFIRKTLQFGSAVIARSYSHLTDCQSLLDRIASASLVDHHFANDTLDPDWDVFNEVVVNGQALAHPPMYQCVKAHQDRKQSYWKLSLKAQLNCDADGYASQHIKLMTHALPAALPFDPTVAPLLPHAGAQVHLQAGTLTHKLKQSLVYAVRSPPLLRDLQVSNSWEDATVASIDWTAHGLALRNTPHHVTIVKLIHDLLPVGVRVHKYDPVQYCQYCPTCTVHVETISHFFRCAHPMRKARRSTFRKSVLDAADKLKTQPMLLNVMMEGVRLLFSGGDYLRPSDFPDEVRELIRQQNRIGWRNFVKGRWSLEWTRIQSKHHRVKASDSSWTAHSIRVLWDAFFEYWEQRNKDRHGSDSESRYAAERKVLTRRITHWYDNQHFYSDTAAIAFSTPLAELLTSKNPQLCNWLQCWTPVFEQCHSG